MKTKILGSAAAAALIIGFMPQALGQATGTGTSSVQVLDPITITAGANLTFGQVAAPATGTGTVTCSTAGAVSSSGLTQVGACTAGTFTVGGEDGSSFSITLPTSATLNSGGNSLTVDTFLSDPSGTGSIATGGTTVNVGATLNVPSTAAAGSYTGTYAVTVDYN